MSLDYIKILLVDDDAFVRAMLGEILQIAGYQVEIAENGIQALEMLQQSEFDLILSDMNMVPMNGLELIKAIRAEQRDTPFVMLTVNKEISVALEAIRSGANDYLLKDENIQETIFVAIDQTLEKHLLKKKNIELMESLLLKNQELEVSNEALIQLNQQKNKLIGIAAHDIRGPVSAIMGLSEILLDDLKEGAIEDYEQYLKMLVEISQGILLLLNDLLDVSVIESGKLEIKYQSYDMRKLIEERLAIAKFAAEKKNIKIVSNLSAIHKVMSDHNRISQVIDNLVGNAIKFSPPQSIIEVTLLQENDSVYFGVKDQGPGIAETDRSKLFGEFQRLSAQPTGGEKSTGLGLAIVKKIIDAHHGTMKVESQLGSGSIFGFYIPTNHSE